MKKLLLLTVLIVCLQVVPSVSAHVFVSSDTGLSSAIVHVMPDDDPIAGQETSMFFDIRSDVVSTDTHSFSLDVSGSDGQVIDSELNPVGSSGVSSKVVFPHQGLYRVELTATSNTEDTQEKLVLNQRVSRGSLSNGLAIKPTYSWAEAGLVGAVCLIIGIIIIIINRRGTIFNFTHEAVKRRRK